MAAISCCVLVGSEAMVCLLVHEEVSNGVRIEESF